MTRRRHGLEVDDDLAASLTDVDRPRRVHGHRQPQEVAPPDRVPVVLGLRGQYRGRHRWPQTRRGNATAVERELPEAADVRRALRRRLRQHQRHRDEDAGRVSHGVPHSFWAGGTIESRWLGSLESHHDSNAQLPGCVRSATI